MREVDLPADSAIGSAGADVPGGPAAPLVDVDRRNDGLVTISMADPLGAHEPFVLHGLMKWAESDPQRLLMAQRDGQGRWQRLTYGAAVAAVRSIGASLLMLGAGPERPLMILSENSIEHALMTFAAMYVGVPVSPVSPSYAGSRSALGRVRDMASVVQPWLVFCQDGLRYAACTDAIGLPLDRVIAVGNVPAGALAYADLQATSDVGPADRTHADLHPDGPAKYMFTSGSTGMPKAVVQTHRMLAAAQQMGAQSYAAAYGSAGGRSGSLVTVDWLPWHHVMGGNVVLHRLLHFGGTLYLDDGRPTPERFGATLANLREHPPTSYFNVPAGIAMLLDELEKDADFAAGFFSRLDFLGYGGASLSAAIHDRLQAVAARVTGHPVVVSTAYGTTETSGPALTRNWDAGDIGVIGLPYPGIEAKLLPLDGEPGRFELRIKGPNIFSVYLRNPEASRAAFDDGGYLRLGDAVIPVVAGQPEKGLLFAGRLSEDFKLSSGTWVRSAALRAQLLSALAPLVSEAMIVGEGRDRVCAFVWVSRPGCHRLHPRLEDADDVALVGDAGLHEMLAARLQAINSVTQGATSRIHAIALLAEPLSLQHYELTDKGNVNVRAVLGRRSADLEALYASSPHAHVVVSR